MPGCDYSTPECPNMISECPCVRDRHHSDHDSENGGQHMCKHDCTSGFLFNPEINGPTAEEE
jgi:hypothetical protein